MKKLTHILSIVGAIILLLLGGYFAFREPRAEVEVSKSVKVGWIGHANHNAVDLALNDLNMDGVEVLFNSVECNREQVMEALHEMVAQGVLVVVSELCSDAYYLASQELGKSGVVMVQASSDLTDYNDEPMFRTVPHQGQVLAYGIDYLRGKGIDNIGVVGITAGWGALLDELIMSLFEGDDRTLNFVSLLNDQYEEISDDELKVRLEALKEIDPDVIYIVARDGDPARIMTIADEIELDATMYGIGELYDDAEALGEIGNGLRVVVVGGGSSGFVEQYRVAYGEDAGAYEANAYDAMTAVARVLRDGANTREEVVAKLHELSFEGASGKIEFADNGHIPGRFKVMVLEDGKFVQK